MLNKKVIIDSLRNLSKPTKMTNKNSFDFKKGGSKKEGFISAQEGVETPIYKAVKVGASPIEGKGLFADQAIRKGDVIGVSHIRKKFMKDGDEYQAPFPSTVLGYYNHSEEPNVYEVDNGDHIVMVAGRDIQRGQELTSNYNKHNIEDLEVPEDFKKGGATKRPSLPSKKSPKSYSRSFEATNRLFAENPLFKKPKSRKNKIFDPRAQYYAEGGLIQYAPGGDWPPLKKGAVYVNPLYMGNFVGGNNSFDTLTGENAIYDIYNPYSASSFNVGVQLPLSKDRRIDSEKTKGWMMDAYVGMPYSQMIGEDAKFLPSAGVKFDYENSPQNDSTYGFRKFRPFVNLGAEYSPTDGFGVGAFGGGRTPFGEKVKPGYGAGHMDAYAGFQGGLNLGKGNAHLSPIIGGRIKGEYEPNRKSFLNKVLGDDVSIFGEAGAAANFVKGKMTQRETDDTEVVATGNNSVYGGPDFGTAEKEIQSQPDTVGVGFDFYGNVGLKKKFSDFKSTKKNTANKRIQEIEDNEKRAFQESEVEKEEPKKKKPKKECPEGEMRYCADCPCEVIERVHHPRWLEDGGLVQYEPGGYSDEPPGSKKKPYRDKNAILPRWMPDGMIKAIKNTEVGISPLMSNEQAYPMGMKKNFTDIASGKESLLGEGTGAMGISNPAYGINFTTGLTRDVSKNKDTGWALKGYLGRSYDPSLGQAAGAAIEKIGQDTYDARWDEYNQNLAAYNAGTMPATMLYGEDGWDPEKNKPKYDGKLARGLGKAMQKSPLIGGLSAHYRYDKFKQPHGYKAAGEGEIKLDWDPSNNVGLGLKGGLEFYGGNKYHSKNYRPGAYKWNVNPSVTGGIGTRPHFGFNLNAGLEGLPKFMPKNFPGYFYGNVNYNQSLLGPGSLSANAGMKFPLNDLKKRRAKSRVKEKEEEDRIIPNTTSPGGVRTTTFSSQKDGGFIIDLADEDIQKYVDGGYIVEELPKASRGREKKTYVAPKLNEVQFKPVEIQTYNPKLNEYQIHKAELPDRIVPGREYADVKHKMANLRKDLGISGFEHLMNKYIPGAAHPISLVKDSGIVIDPATGKLFDSNTRYWLNREYGFEPSIDQFFQQMSGTLAKDYGKLIMSSDTPFQNRKMGINYMDEFASPYAQKNGLLNLFGEPTGGGSLMIGMGMMGKPEFTKEIKNPDYFNQLLDSYTTKQLSSSSKKFYKDLINSVKNQNGLVTERQYNELQRLKTGNFDFGKKGYADGGLVKAARGLPVKNAKNLGRRANIATVGTANTLAKTFAPVMMNPARIPMLGARVENMGPFTGSPLNALPFYGKKIMPESNTAFRKFGDSLDYVKLSGELNPVHGPLIRMGKDQVAEEGNWAALNQPNEWYPGVMTAKFDFNAPGTNLGFTKIPKRDGVLITDAQGNRMPAIPISDPGLSFQRRLPFSNRYVDVNMNKLRNDQFDISTIGTNTQALLERYGYGMGYAALLGAMGLSAPQEIIDDYINKPLIEGFNKTRDFLQPLDDKAKELLIDPFIKEEGGEIDYELGQEVDEETKRKLEALGYTFEIVK